MEFFFGDIILSNLYTKTKAKKKSNQVKNSDAIKVFKIWWNWMKKKTSVIKCDNLHLNYKAEKKRVSQNVNDLVLTYLKTNM